MTKTLGLKPYPGRPCLKKPLAVWMGVVCVAIFLSSPAWAQTWEAMGPDGGTIIGFVSDAADADRITAVTSYPSPSQVYRTLNGGDQWTKISTVPHVELVDFCAYDFTRLYALSGGGCYYSTDGGVDWTFGAFPPSSGAGNCITVDSSDPNRVYAAGSWSFGTNHELIFYKSTDGGASWTTKVIANKYGKPWDIAVSPGDPDLMYICGYQQNGPNFFLALYRSDDGGKRWTDISALLENMPFQYLYSLAIDPTNDDHVYAGGTYFYKSTDGGASWTKNTSHVFGAETLCVDPVDPSHVYAAGTGKIFTSTDWGASFTEHTNVLDGYGSYMEVAPALHTTVYAASLYGGFYRSADSGGTWSDAYAGIHACVIPALAVAPSRPETVWVDVAEAFTVMASYDCAEQWTLMTYPNGCSGTITDFLICSDDPQVILALEAG